MHYYRKIKEDMNWLYTVWYWEPLRGKGGLGYSGDGWNMGWVALEDTSNEGEARALVNYLNGGEGKVFTYERA